MRLGSQVYRSHAGLAKWNSELRGSSGRCRRWLRSPHHQGQVADVNIGGGYASPPASLTKRPVGALSRLLAAQSCASGGTGDSVGSRIARSGTFYR